jgi:nucleotide-binding universal stress UspA family protein
MMNERDVKALRPNRWPLGVRSIFHPTDFSPESQVAFMHALRLALACRAELRIMHIESRPGETSWQHFPQVRETLSHWGLLPPGSDREAVARLGLRVDKIVATGRNPARSILDYLERHPADLLVIATHQSGGLTGWLGTAIAEPQVEGFVSREGGKVQVRRVLIPVDREPDPALAIDAAADLISALDCGPVSFTLLHVGAEAKRPQVTLRTHPGWTWQSVTREGAVVEQILAVAKEESSDLIAMATQGHKGFLDALRGSTTDRVLRDARAPVLAVPAAQEATEAIPLRFSPTSPKPLPA